MLFRSEFTILSCDTRSDSPGPAPAGSTHWELRVKSDQFPEDSFFVCCRKNDGAWHWTDTYYSLLLRDEITSEIMASVRRFFAADCLTEILWPRTAWPKGVGEGSTFYDWLHAGGPCPTIQVYLKETVPEQARCQTYTDCFLTEFSQTKWISFRGLKEPAFDEFHTQNRSPGDLWDAHPEWRLGCVSCSSKAAGKGRHTMENASILRQAGAYLSSRYSANFSIKSMDRISNALGPIPSMVSSYHWELVVESDQFPNETFKMRYLKAKDQAWYWLDNYFTLLLRKEAEIYFSGILQEHLHTAHMINIGWGTTTWPPGTQEGSTFHEWLQAGGKITTLQVFLDGVIPADDFCYSAAKRILELEPNVLDITFFGLSGEGFAKAMKGSPPIGVYQEEFQEDRSQLRRIYYGQWQFREETYR